MRRIASAVAVLAALELALRLGGLAYLARQRWSSGSGYWERGTTRVLCLGESTTAGGPTSYPAQLETLLNEGGGGRRFAVVNRGLPGTDSEAILAALPDDLERYAPDYVVVMMGINDGGRTRIRSNARAGWRSLRVVKLALLLFGPRPDVSTWGVPDDERRLTLIRALEARRDAASDSVERLAMQAKIMMLSRRYREAETLYRKANELDPMPDWDAATGEALVAQGRFREARTPLRRALARRPGDADIAHALAECEWALGALESPGPPTPDPLAHPETARRYLELAALVERAGAKLVAVQYPMRPVGPLEALVGSRAAAVVGNEAPFKRTLAKGRARDLFVDLFAGDFGHCTAAGNRLLAADVARAVLALR